MNHSANDISDDPSRRELQFETLSDAVADAKRLLAGYRQVGNWNLTQSIQHCDIWIQYYLDGFPKNNFLLAGLLWLMRNAFGKKLLRQILASGKMKRGMQTLPQTIPVAIDGEPGNAAEVAAIESLAKTIKRLKDYDEKSDGPLHFSPLFGQLDKDMAVKLHTIHTAHHLSFLLPTDLS